MLFSAKNELMEDYNEKACFNFLGCNNGAKLDGCGYTIEFDKSVDPDTVSGTCRGLYGGGVADYTIKNLNLTGVAVSPAANTGNCGILIEHNANNLTVENVVVDVDYVVKGAHTGGVSAMVGKLDEAAYKVNFNNVHFTGSLTVNETFAGTDYPGTGAFIGETRKETYFNNCSNSGTITINGDTASRDIGGFVGKSKSVSFDNCDADMNVIVNGKTEGSNVGGFVGCATKATVNISDTTSNPPKKNEVGVNITFNETITKNNIGGLFGKTTNTVSISDVIVTGAINETVSDNANTDTSYGVGGFIGQMGGDDQDSKIQDSTNRANLTVKVSRVNAGGIVGRLAGNTRLTVERCENYGEISSDVTNSTSHSSIGTGGIIGHVVAASSANAALTVSDCNNYADLTGVGDNKNHMFGGIVGRMTKDCNLRISYSSLPHFQWTLIIVVNLWEKIVKKYLHKK